MRLAFKYMISYAIWQLSLWNSEEVPVPRSAVQLRRCHVRAVVRTFVGHVMRWYVCLLCTIASENARSSLMPILGRRNHVKLMCTKYIIFKQNELVKQYNILHYTFSKCSSMIEPSQGDGDGSETKYGGESLMQKNEVYIQGGIQNVRDWRCKNRKTHYKVYRPPSPSK
jgi:hypothetical protein